MMTPEQQEAREAYDAACKRHWQLITEAEALCIELEAMADICISAGRWEGHAMITRILVKADRRYARRVAADVEF